mmetsp:Transcript_39701/g.88213  ORF Transcript_39701/g.88213 Transcript_39701/m.88213 type:complete len:127 (-) Transcript_39701:26-406(-)
MHPSMTFIADSFMTHDSSHVECPDVTPYRVLMAVAEGSDGCSSSSRTGCTPARCARQLLRCGTQPGAFDLQLALAAHGIMFCSNPTGRGPRGWGSSCEAKGAGPGSAAGSAFQRPHFQVAALDARL